jgi:hypothetical protein
MEFYDNSRLKDYRKCPRYYLLRHKFGWNKPGSAPALGFGLGWHSGMDEIWKFLTQHEGQISGRLASDLSRVALLSWQEQMEEMQIDYLSPMYSQLEPKRTQGVAHEMFYNYILNRGSYIQTFDLRACEQPFAVPLGDLPEVYYIGRQDKEVSIKGREGIHVVDHKTTSSYSKAAGFQQAFLESFSPDPQIDGYAYASYLQHGKKFRSVLIDCALVHKTEHNVFKVIPVQRTFSNLDAWLWEAEDWVRRIWQDLAELEDCSPGDLYLRAFPKCERCFEFFRSCIFKDLCRFHSNPLQLESPPKGFILDVWNPFEVNKISKLGLKEAK